MNANHFKDKLLSLEEQLQETTAIKQEPPHHSARHLYFELQRLVHQYASHQIRPGSEKIS
jgi:hypothetical protein